LTVLVFRKDDILGVISQLGADGQVVAKLLAEREGAYNAKHRAANRRGPKPKRRLEIESRMLTDIKNGFDVAGEKEEALAEHYNASRDTVRQARKSVLDKLRQNPDKIPTRIK
jgi:hypothetical protein